MSSRLSVFHSPVDPDDEPPLIEEAVVATTPTDLEDDVYVTVGLDRRKVGPVLGWRTAPEAAWPTRGDIALIAHAPQSDTWFIGWEPTP